MSPLVSGAIRTERSSHGSFVVVGDVNEGDLLRDGRGRGWGTPLGVAYPAAPSGLFLDVARKGIEEPHRPEGRGGLVDIEFREQVQIEETVSPVGCGERKGSICKRQSGSVPPGSFASTLQL